MPFFKKTECNSGVYWMAKRYNAEHDMLPQGMPQVTWAENYLLSMCLELLERVQELERKLEEIEQYDQIRVLDS